MSTLTLIELNTASEYMTQTPVIGTAVQAAPNAFAAAPALPFPKSGAKARTASPARSRRAASARRRLTRVNWDTVGIVLLMLACTVVGIYRLLWMGL